MITNVLPAFLMVHSVFTKTVSFSEQSSRRIDSSYGSTGLISSLCLIVYNIQNNFNTGQ